jgi:photosystem II stability/assembly factor-like uncharacterized protein
MRYTRPLVHAVIAAALFTGAANAQKATSKSQPKNAKAAESQTPDPVPSGLLNAMQFRSVGPALTTGRVQDVEMDPHNSSVWYVATAFGGLWKTTNRGVTFTSVFDNGGSFTLCCVEVDPKNSNIVWLGTGENLSQRSAHFGDGLYKSTDAGKTWKRVALELSEHIGRIQIDPRNSDVVYVAAQGPLWSAGGERGLYKTTDGGNTWKAVLTISENTGVNDVVLDPSNPDVVYATPFQRRRAVGQLIGGGPEGGIMKSTDGGAHWTKLTNGLPKGDVGRVSLAIDPRHNNTVYANIAATRNEAGFYRSDDAGATWERIGKRGTAAGRGAGAGGGAGGGGRAGAPADDWYRGDVPEYYNEIFADPRKENVIWAVDTNLQISTDGGHTFRSAGFESKDVHTDYHDIEFDPQDMNHFLIANDGGLYETYDDGATFRYFANIPVTQYYRVSVSNTKPFYLICGGAQDNWSECGPSRTTSRLGIRNTDWFIVGGGDGFQTRNDPEDPNIVYATSQDGAVSRMDIRTGVSKGIRPRLPAPTTAAPPSRDEGAIADTSGNNRANNANTRRFNRAADRPNWDAPYIISPHSSRRLYWASNYVYRSDDRGDTWTRVSPDLTRQQNADSLPIMGRIWPDTAVSKNASTTALGNVVSIDESPLMEGLIYAGTDDGLLQITEDGGRNWRRVDVFPGVPHFTYVSDVFASPRDANTVFVALNNWQRGDYKPYIVKSSDRGRTWTNISSNLPDRHDVWSVIQDHINGDLLFAGTEFALFTSIDGGRHWNEMKGGMPVAQVRDMAVQRRENDLVLATFGRGFYVLDDFSALRDMNATTLAEDVHLFPLRDASFFNITGGQDAGASGHLPMAGIYSTPNPAVGATFTYNVKTPITDSTKLVLTIMDDAGKQVRRLDLDKSVGLKRLTWNLRADPPARAAADSTGRAGDAGGAGGAGGGGGFGGRGPQQGAVVPPGRYRAVIGRMVGTTVTNVGNEQTFNVVVIPQ